LAACIDPEEERRLREELVLAAMPIAQGIASRYRSRGETADDLIQAAHLGLKAASCYVAVRTRGYGAPGSRAATALRQRPETRSSGRVYDTRCLAASARVGGTAELTCT
jgi:hypothetical protein